MRSARCHRPVEPADASSPRAVDVRLVLGNRGVTGVAAPRRFFGACCAPPDKGGTVGRVPDPGAGHGGTVPAIRSTGGCAPLPRLRSSSGRKPGIRHYRCGVGSLGPDDRACGVSSVRMQAVDESCSLRNMWPRPAMPVIRPGRKVSASPNAGPGARGRRPWFEGSRPGRKPAREAASTTSNTPGAPWQSPRPGSCGPSASHMARTAARAASSRRSILQEPAADTRSSAMPAAPWHQLF